MSNIPEMEKILLKGLLSKEDLAREVTPYIQDEYFETMLSRSLFKIFKEYLSKYNSCPPKDVILLEHQNNDLLNEQQFADGKEIIDDVFSFDISKYDMSWFREKTEKWCQDRALINAVYDSIGIIDGSNKKKTTHAIPDMMREALSVCFDSTVGHDYTLDVDERYDFYHNVETKMAFDISMWNQITKGGVSRKTLNVFMGPTGGGKSQALCHLAAGYIRSGLNVLYVTCEMAEERIAERIDANILDVDIDTIPKMDENVYKSKMAKVIKNIRGRLVIKEYPAASANVNHLRFLLQDLKTKKNFIPDVVIVDYLNIMCSARYSNNSSANSYTTVKATAEELRGLAQQENVVMWSATQTNRDGIGASDLTLQNTSESIGLPQTTDLMLGLVPMEELEAKKQIMVVQLKNRYGPLDPNRRFIVGLDRSHMKFYDVAVSAQNNIGGNASSSPVITSPVQDKHSFGSGFGAETGSVRDKFDGIDFE